jgi:hypothetical protein
VVRVKRETTFLTPARLLLHMVQLRIRHGGFV